MSARGLDFLAARAWLAEVSARGLPRATAVSDGLPSFLLPIAVREPVIVGREADSHRRGRGLPFPVEAQTPVMGRSENEAGRVLLAAAFECLARAETEWGQLADTKFCWRPDGVLSVQVDAAKAIAEAVEHSSEEGDSIGLVVPDSLGVAGQQAILEAIRNREVILVPRSIAAALTWCRQDIGGHATSGPSREFTGYLTVTDLSLGRWSITKVPVFRSEVGEHPLLAPAHFPASKRTALGSSGLGTLTEQGGFDYHDALRKAFCEPWLNGSRFLRLADHDGFAPRRARFASLRDLEGGGLLEGLEELRAMDRQLATPPDWGTCLGVIVTGALAGARADELPLSSWVGRHLSQPVLESTERAAAQGAALAAAGLGTNLPTWLEMVDQLDLYYIGRNDLGDLEPAWRRVLTPGLVKAGSEYRNPEPITGLKLQAGRNSVQITIRRPDESGKMLYRRVESAPGRTTEADIPLLIDVVARPGQGFAVVKVRSKEAGTFDSHLDWQKMAACEEPEGPALGYIPAAVELVPDSRLWSNAEPELERLLSALVPDSTPRDVERAARVVNPKISRSVALMQPDPVAPQADAVTVFRFSRALGREGEAPSPVGQRILSAVRVAGLKWLANHRFGSKGARWLVKHFGWWHLGCPRELVVPVLHRLGTAPKECTSDDLHLAGLALAKPRDVQTFFVAYLAAMPAVASPNAWLKAFRNIVKFNEHALRETHSVVAEDLYLVTVRRLEWAIDKSRPLIAQHCLEALLFCLKRRRYEETFVKAGSPAYNETASLLHSWDRSGHMRDKPKLREVNDTFARFLRTEGNLRDLATLLEDEDVDESAD